MIHYMSVQGVGDAWVGNELHVVDQAGIPFVLHALRPTKRVLFASEWAARINQNTRTLYPLPIASFIASVLLAPFLFRGRFFSALVNALLGKRESVRNRLAVLAHLFVAAHWARSLRHEQVTHIHSQWIHSGGTVAWYGAWLLGKSFSFTGHAADLFRERVALEDKIRSAEFIVCISEFHREFFKKMGASDRQLVIAYCGIDVSLFTPRARLRKSAEPLQIRSSGRLVEKKGFEYLIRACAILRERGLDFRCLIGGSGPLHPSLLKLVSDLGLADRVELTNVELKQEEIPAFMYGGDVYCLPCVWAEDGDVDGLPQMLMEAMACGLPAISTRLVGIPDLVIHEKTGLLVEPRQIGALSDAIRRLALDEALASRLSGGALEHLRDRFDLSRSLDPLLGQYRRRLNDPLHQANLQIELPRQSIGVSEAK